MIIDDLPFQVLDELILILDQHEDWKELADRLEFSAYDIEEIEKEAKRFENSPSKILLERCKKELYTISILYLKFYRMEHIKLMRCLEKFVDKPLKRKLAKLEAKYNITDSFNGNNDTTTELNSCTQSLHEMNIDKILQRSNNTPLNISASKNTAVSCESNQQNVEFQRLLSGIPFLGYETLKKATGNWSESYLLGRGGFGQVYEGKWEVHPMAIKRLLRADNTEELLRELSSLNKYRHNNILPLYGYSYGGPEACLVYQLMCGGSLEQRLRSKTRPRLTWTQRYNIVHGVARGLWYLHTINVSPLIHGDIKPANILLDENLKPKIGDFGLARKGPNNVVKVNNVHGTKAYLPNEYTHFHDLSTAVDVFSYGVVMMEVATALPAMYRSKELYLYQYIHQFAATQKDMSLLEDPSLRGTPESNPELCREFIKIGIDCTNSARQERPSMLNVYESLSRLNKLLKEN